jgi:hypothetical protein
MEVEMDMKMEMRRCCALVLPEMANEPLITGKLPGRRAP